MGACPKNRISKLRGRKRRTHYKAEAPTLAVCPNCGASHIYHTVCGECGYYRGKLAIEQLRLLLPSAHSASKANVLIMYARLVATMAKKLRFSTSKKIDTGKIANENRR